MDRLNADLGQPTSTNRIHPDTDQRKTERLVVALPLTYVVEIAGRQLIGDAETLNISGGGVQFLVQSLVPADSPCLIHLTLPGDTEPVSFHGTVLRCQAGAGEYGAQFEVAVAWAAHNADREVMFARYCNFVATELLKKYLP